MRAGDLQKPLVRSIPRRIGIDPMTSLKEIPVRVTTGVRETLASVGVDASLWTFGTDRPRPNIRRIVPPRVPGDKPPPAVCADRPIRCR